MLLNIFNNIVFVCIISLAIGSFLNVIITRLPIILETTFIKECKQFLETHKTRQIKKTFNLLIPRSHCPNCNHTLSLLENIPILSYLFLKRKCRNCKKSISAMYIVVELLTLSVSIIVFLKFGFTLKTLFALILCYTLITQSCIDLKHLMIPDEITMPILWLGLIINCFSIFNSPVNSIFGAVYGYLTLWTIYWLFKLITKKEGLGYGDFKLLAMLGAWLGWQYLPLIVVLSATLGSIFGVFLIIRQNKTLSYSIPYGPHLAIAGITALLYGTEINTFYLKLFPLVFP